MYENTVKNTVIYHKRYSTIKLPIDCGIIFIVLLTIVCFLIILYKSSSSLVMSTEK